VQAVRITRGGRLHPLLVAEGLSNPQIGGRLFTSRRTVQTHLGHISAKLDMSSPAQLAAEATRHQPG
jgi:DNA-binding CsgD family transcriptional regulator